MSENININIKRNKTEKQTNEKPKITKRINIKKGGNQ